MGNRRRTTGQPSPPTVKKSGRPFRTARGKNVHVIAYPSGRYNSLAQVTLLENGFDISFTTEEGTNTLIKGQPQSLLGLHRYNMNQSVSVEQLMEWVSPARG